MNSQVTPTAITDLLENEKKGFYNNNINVEHQMLTTGSKSDGGCRHQWPR